MLPKIPVTVIIATKNEQNNLQTCIDSAADFDQIIIFDSASKDKTKHIADNNNISVINFLWNGKYPKKRQYFLDNHTDKIKHDWIFWLDADERVTPLFTDELIKKLNAPDSDQICGFFVKARYKINDKTLKFGMANNKLALFRHKQMHFPVVNDLDIIPGIGEIEGHYQPIKKNIFKHQKISSIRAPIIHLAFNTMHNWHERHQRYAHWEDEMDKRHAWPNEDNKKRVLFKRVFKAIPAPIKSVVFFIYGYIIKLGFLDAKEGFIFAKLRASYYWR